jgi:hypothetical protein
MDRTDSEFQEGMQRLSSAGQSVVDKFRADSAELMTALRQGISARKSAHDEALARIEQETEFYANQKREFADTSDISTRESVRAQEINFFMDECEKEMSEVRFQSAKSANDLETLLDLAYQKARAAEDRNAQRPPRECDLRAIEDLDYMAEILLIRLKNAAKDLVQYRKLLIAKESEYNSLFGRNPSVGLLVFQPSSRS